MGKRHQVFVKYGQAKEHLQQIVNGRLRFCPSENYIKQEKEQNDKGQGDLLEGKIPIKVSKITFKSHEDGKISILNGENLVYLSLEKVNKIPIFCLSHYEQEVVCCTDKFKLRLNQNQKDCINRDFKHPKYALIILEPDVFIIEIYKSQKGKFFSDEIQYFDYQENDLQRIMYIMDTQFAGRGSTYSMPVSNSHRALFCKDKYFVNQNEYRLVLLNKLIESEYYIDFKMKSRYLIVETADLFNETEFSI